MEPKTAARVAKAYVADQFEGEGIINIGLEEIVFDDAAGTWDITIGFSRPWDQPRQPLFPKILDFDPPAHALPRLHRDYRVVRVRDADGQVLSVTLRDVAA